MSSSVAPVDSKLTRPKWSLKFDFLKQPGFLAALMALAGVVFAFWPLIRSLPGYWLDFESYYGHGLLIAPAAAWIIYKRWPKIKELPVQGHWLGLALLVPIFYLAWVTSRTEMPLLMSAGLIAALLSSILYVAGWKWLKALAAPVLFLTLGLPMIDRFIDPITFKLQLISADLAVDILKMLDTGAIKLAPTMIHLDHYTLEVVEACSGLKTTIAVTAIVAFLLLTSKLKIWASGLLAAIAIPMSIGANGLRIALIGWVGNSRGEEAAAKFHDASGWVVMVACFLLLSQLTHFMEDRS